ncbi:hypothetical protein BDV98DRAFT_352858 [Pterulicium gracile]|uniref:Uncharacterized protein n=1 Tax=Pterulicium gracile TaxID=1884261 RepID=A0A5C3QPZ2_9AGAR|nr:hypothetical protein BDV98DRAFT_352858 [Pterula gracilis]
MYKAITAFSVKDVYGTALANERLIPMLRRLPQLRELHIEHRGWRNPWDLDSLLLAMAAPIAVADIDSPPTMCPQIQRLHLSGPDALTFSCGALKTFVESRFGTELEHTGRTVVGEISNTFDASYRVQVDQAWHDSQAGPSSQDAHTDATKWLIEAHRVGVVQCYAGDRVTNHQLQRTRRETSAWAR